MKIGVGFSHPEMGNDPAVIRDFAQAVEGAGFDHVLAAEHVAGGHPDRLRGERVHLYDIPYHDPFVLFGFMAGATRSLGFCTSILILPQRQTAVVAKQAADLDLLCGGRLRLGVGVGRNWMEYELLGENFKNRGRRVEEQIAVLRRFWSEELVTFEGKYHQVDRMGLNPLPIQRPIPIWMGSYTTLVESVLERVGRLADGWLPQFPPTEETRAMIERLHGYARAAGRDPADIGIEAGVSVRGGNPDEWAKTARAWRNLGATHLRVNTMGAGFTSPQQHIDAAIACKEAITAALG